MSPKQERRTRKRSKEQGETSGTLARETASGQLVATPTSRRVIKATSAAHRETLKRLVDR